MGRGGRGCRAARLGDWEGSEKKGWGRSYLSTGESLAVHDGLGTPQLRPAPDLIDERNRERAIGRKCSLKRCGRETCPVLGGVDPGGDPG